MEHEKYVPAADEIKEMRTHHRLTREEFGTLVYQTPRSVAAWECGERVCPPAYWELILWKLDGILPERAEFYNKNQLYLFEEGDAQSENTEGA